MEHLSYMKLENVDQKIQHQKKIMNRNLDKLFTKEGNLVKRHRTLHQNDQRKVYLNSNSEQALPNGIRTNLPLYQGVGGKYMKQFRQLGGIHPPNPENVQVIASNLCLDQKIQNNHYFSYEKENEEMINYLENDMSRLGQVEEIKISRNRQSDLKFHANTFDDN